MTEEDKKEFKKIKEEFENFFELFPSVKEGEKTPNLDKEKALKFFLEKKVSLEIAQKLAQEYGYEINKADLESKDAKPEEVTEEKKSILPETDQDGEKTKADEESVDLKLEEADEKVASPKEVPSGEQKTVKKVKIKKGKKKIKRQVSLGRVYIQATYNNTIVTFTDQNGNVLAWSSAGQCGFKGPKKSTPYAASVIVRNAAEKVAPYGLKEVNVFVKGVGSGRESAVRALNANGIQVLNIKDVTPIPHNGCRAKKVRRV